MLVEYLFHRCDCCWFLFTNVLIVFVYLCGPQKSCISERLSEYAGKDATKEFNDADHSDIAMALVEKCLVGNYTEVSLFHSTLAYTLVPFYYS